MNEIWLKRRKRLFEILEVGTEYDYASRAYDFANAIAIVLNLTVSVLYTFAEIRVSYGDLLLMLERITVGFFCIDYILRLLTAHFLYPDNTELRALWKYITSFTGLVDMLSFLPYYLPIFFPSGATAFRMIRIVRIFRLFRINAYYDSLNVITEVIYGKKQQLISSVFIILILMIVSSLCMYSLEHEAQPDVFTNAFSRICITFLGVGMVANPTGIISAGFVDQYSTIKRRIEYGAEADMHFIKVHLREKDRWVGKSIAQLGLPAGVIASAIKRDGKILIPREG